MALCISQLCYGTFLLFMWNGLSIKDTHVIETIIFSPKMLTLSYPVNSQSE